MGRANQYEGCESAAELAAALQNRIARNKVTIAEIQAVKFLASLRGWSLPTDSAPESAVNSVSSVIPDSFIRDRCVSDKMFLANEILGFESPAEHEVLFSDFPQRRPGIIEPDPIPNRLILWSRGLGKSTCVAVDIAQAVCHDKNVRILYQTSDDDLAKNRLQQIADFFDHPTEAFSKTFPELCGLEQRTVRQFIVRGRTNRSSIDPTFLISTPGMDTTGSRFDLIFLDDLVNLKNAATEAGREKAYEVYRAIRSQRSADARIVITGTCYHAEDAYARIQKAASAEGSTRWLIDRRSCWSYRCKNCGEKDLFHSKAAGRSCPNFESDGVRGVIIDRFVTRHGEAIGYTVDWLENERSEAGIGLKHFTLQYENNPAPEAGLNLPTWSHADLTKLFGQDPYTL